MESFLEKIKAGVKNTKVIKWPGTEEEVQLKILSNGEHQKAAFAAENLFKQKGIEFSSATADAYQDEKNTQVLYLALQTVDGKPVAPNVNQFRDMITREEKESLIDSFLEFEEEVSPRVNDLSENEVLDLLTEIKKKPTVLGSVSSTSTLKRLITILVAQAQT